MPAQGPPALAIDAVVPGTPKSARLGGLGMPAQEPAQEPAAIATDAIVLEDAPVGDPAPAASAPVASDPRSQCLAKVSFGDLPGTAGSAGDDARTMLMGSFVRCCAPA